MRGDHVCVGAYDIDARVNVRVLTPDGNYFHGSSAFDVGQLGELRYYTLRSAAPPHVEDALLSSWKCLEYATDLRSLIMQHCEIVRGPLRQTFERKLRRSAWNGSAYIGPEAVPAYSVCFWEADQHLILDSSEAGRIRFAYPQARGHCYVPYVGCKEPPEAIPKGALVRLSLAKWWQPDGVLNDPRCYLQVSGVFA